MITIDRTTPYTKTQRSKQVERTTIIDNDVAKHAPRVPIVDRRKNNDRRNKRGNKILLESRSGSERRKNANSRRPSIDIKA